MMKILVLLALLGLHGAAAVSHTLQYFYTASTGMERFPEFVAVGIVDGEQIDYYDSVSEKNVLKQTWMEGVRDENNIADIRRGAQQAFKGNVGIAMQRFNQTTGAHVFQKMYGCEWDDETQEVTGYTQYGYDGEDFIVFDLKTETLIAPSQQAVITKHKWESNKGWIPQEKNYLTQICPEWVKKYLNYGHSSLMRTDPPSVSLLQKTPSSPVSCHATGFYPNKAVMFWRKNGEELHEDVDQGEILPNHDGSFQKTIHLSSVKHEDWGNCECVFQLSGLKEDIVTKLEKSDIKTNASSTPLIGIVIAAVVVLTLVIGAVGFFIYRKKSAKRPPSPAVSNPEVMEQLNPTPSA